MRRRTAPHIDLQFIHINKRIKIPIYRQLYEAFRNAILNGMLKPADRLPSSRQLAEDLQISRTVVNLAMEQLLLEGFITAQTGKGSFVANSIVSASEKLKKVSPARNKPLSGRFYNSAIVKSLQSNVVEENSAFEKIIPFQISVPDLSFFPFNAWISLAGRVHRYMSTYHLGYHDSAGYEPLRKVVSDYIRLNRGVRCSPQQLIITNGSRQALWLLAQLLLQKGDRYWMENPGYAGADWALSHTGATPAYIPITEREGMDIDIAIKKCPEAKLAFVTPSHQYPLGGAMPLARRQQLIQWASKRNMWIIEDDYDSELRYEGKPIPSLQGIDTHHNVIYVGTFSKVVFPALRIAYVVMPTERDAQLLARCKAMCDRQNSLIDQMILADFIGEGFYARMLKKMRRHYAQKLEYMCELVTEYLDPYVFYEKPLAGMHLTCFFRKSTVARKFFEKVKESGLIAPSLQDFGKPPFNTPGFLLGYTAFKEKLMKQSLMKLENILKACYVQG